MRTRLLSVLTALLLCTAPLPAGAYSDPAWMYGDLNGDGLCNASDASTVLLHAAAVGIGSPGMLDTGQLQAADMNGDGAVNARDASEILIFSALRGAGCRLTPNDFVYQRRLPVQASAMPEFAGEPYTVVHDGEPFFTVSDYDVSASFEDYSAFDSLGRCRVCTANIGQDLMPTEPRGEIGMVKPSGWHTVRYDGLVDGNYLYNRCHLIGFQLAGENANVLNLITGTRYLNVQGMLPFENQVADYIHKTGNHVLYRVTPVFALDDLVAHGVLMEAYSVEDAGKGVQFCVYCWNAQPGIVINYPTGDSQLDETAQPSGHTELYYDPAIGVTYICNTNTQKFHEPDCPDAGLIQDKNRREVSNTAAELTALGFEHCRKCSQ